MAAILTPRGMVDPAPEEGMAPQGKSCPWGLSINNFGHWKASVFQTITALLAIPG